MFKRKSFPKVSNNLWLAVVTQLRIHFPHPDHNLRAYKTTDISLCSQVCAINYARTSPCAFSTYLLAKAQQGHNVASWACRVMKHESIRYALSEHIREKGGQELCLGNEQQIMTVLPIPVYVTAYQSMQWMQAANFHFAVWWFFQNHTFSKAQENASEAKKKNTLKSINEGKRLNFHTLSPANNCLYLSSKLKVLMQQQATTKQVNPATGPSSLYSHIAPNTCLYAVGYKCWDPLHTPQWMQRTHHTHASFITKMLSIANKNVTSKPYFLLCSQLPGKSGSPKKCPVYQGSTLSPSCSCSQANNAAHNSLPCGQSATSLLFNPKAKSWFS